MDEMKLREIRKLIDILSTWGNVLVPGGKHANERLKEIIDELNKQGFTIDDIDLAMANIN